MLSGNSNEKDQFPLWSAIVEVDVVAKFTNTSAEGDVVPVNITLDVENVVWSAGEVIANGTVVVAFCGAVSAETSDVVVDMSSDEVLALELTMLC